MNVYTYFDSSENADPNQAALLRLWVRCWSECGWRPRILTVRNAEQHPFFSKLRHDPRNFPRLAQESAKVRRFCPMTTMNFGMTPGQLRRLGMPIIRNLRDPNRDPKKHPIVDVRGVSIGELESLL